MRLNTRLKMVCVVQEELEQAKAEQEGFLATVAGKPADGSVSKKPDLHKYILKPSQFDGESKEVKVLDWVIVVQLYLQYRETRAGWQMYCHL